jgi:tetratricopeptide (TPR) repeat protein
MKKGSGTQAFAAAAVCRALLVSVALLLSSCDPNVFSILDVQPNSHQDALRYSREAAELRRRERFHDAILLFERALLLDPRLGEARLELAKTWLEHYRFNLRENLKWFDGDGWGSAPVGGQPPLIDSWARLDSVYQAVSHAAAALAPMFSEGYFCSDNFEPEWVLGDYSVIIMVEMVAGAYDINADRVIDSTDQVILQPVIQLDNRGMHFAGFDEVAQDSETMRLWQQKSDELVERIPDAFALFRQAFPGKKGARLADILFSRILREMGAIIG